MIKSDSKFDPGVDPTRSHNERKFRRLTLNSPGVVIA